MNYILEQIVINSLIATHATLDSAISWKNVKKKIP
jgi:hypothetical protein